MKTIYDCKTIPLDTILRDEGKLTVIQERSTVPFKIRRVYYIHGVPHGSERGNHAHRKLWQLMVAVNGALGVWLDDGKDRQFVWLSDPTKGLLIAPGIWRELINFEPNTVCLVLASERYNEKDYIRDYYEFLNYKGC